MIPMAMIALAALGSAPATAQSAPAQAPAAAAAAAPRSPADEKIVCEKQEQLGTRLGARKVCMTVWQWAEQRRLERADLEKVQQVVNQSPSN